MAGAQPHRAARAAQPTPDLQVQGEYLGKLSRETLGAQVIALGRGRYTVVFLPGGLPGDGWDRRTRAQAPAVTEGDVVQIGQGGTGWSGEIAGGKIKGRTAKDAPFELARVTRVSPTLGARPPSGAMVLFDGTNVNAWQGGSMTPDHLLENGTRTRKAFQDFAMHVEFRVPYKPEARGQDRGNSGIYLVGRYEVQILDSFGMEGTEGKVQDCGAIYWQKAPNLNMCYPPLTWQTYDIDFRAVRRDDEGRKTRPAVITVRHNGVVVHDRYELSGNTGNAGRYPETGSPAPISLQSHGNPVVFRNIWIVEK